MCMTQKREWMFPKNITGHHKVNAKDRTQIRSQLRKLRTNQIVGPEILRYSTENFLVEDISTQKKKYVHMTGFNWASNDYLCFLSYSRVQEPASYPIKIQRYARTAVDCTWHLPSCRNSDHNKHRNAGTAAAWLLVYGRETEAPSAGARHGNWASTACSGPVFARLGNWERWTEASKERTEPDGALLESNAGGLSAKRGTRGSAGSALPDPWRPGCLLCPQLYLNLRSEHYEQEPERYEQSEGRAEKSMGNRLNRNKSLPKFFQKITTRLVSYPERIIAQFLLYLREISVRAKTKKKVPKTKMVDFFVLEDSFNSRHSTNQRKKNDSIWSRIDETINPQNNSENHRK
jgi:hypothetical protein